MSDQLSKTELSKLPPWIRQKIEQLEINDPEQWIHKSIPALGNLSVIETLRKPSGEEALREYFSKVSGRF
jgi:hypothetical protein